MFKWDGSELTEFINSKDVYIEEGIYEKKIMYKINYKEKTEICFVRACSSIIPCIIDEFKPIFNLEKIGTHWIKYMGRILIFTRPYINNGAVVDEIPLNYFVNPQKNLSFRREVQKILIFREILGVSRSGEKSIICRKTKFNIKPMSYYESNMIPLKNKKTVSNIMLKKWFNDTCIDKEIVNFLKIKNPSEITDLIFNLRNKMKKVVNRIDKNAITCIDGIVSRIQNRLQHILNV